MLANVCFRKLINYFHHYKTKLNKSLFEIEVFVFVHCKLLVEYCLLKESLRSKANILITCNYNVIINRNTEQLSGFGDAFGEVDICR